MSRSRPSPPVLRESPYTAARDESVTRRMAEVVKRPNGPDGYAAWLVAEWQQEIPDRLHEIDTEPNSVLGSPKLDNRFRSYLHGSDFATDRDDRVDSTSVGAARLRPVHAALRLMAGRGDEHCDKVLMSRFLWRVACSGGDWRTVCDQSDIPSWVAAIYTETALRHLWAIWQRDAIDTAREIAQE